MSGAASQPEFDTIFEEDLEKIVTRYRDEGYLPESMCNCWGRCRPRASPT
mgnify:CR=1 FL=1